MRIPLPRRWKIDPLLISFFQDLRDFRGWRRTKTTTSVCPPPPPMIWFGLTPMYVSNSAEMATSMTTVGILSHGAYCTKHLPEKSLAILTRVFSYGKISSKVMLTRVFRFYESFFAIKSFMQ